jgi:translation initiation factor IF-1
LNLKLAKEEGFTLEGEVVEVLPNAMFRIKIDNMESVVMGIISGRMRMHNIKILLGDRVEVEFSAYDLTKGRIVRRR